MGSRGQQTRKRGGLAETVRDVAGELTNVISVTIGGGNSCRGEQKVKVPIRWDLVRPATLAFTVFDSDNGTRKVFVTTTKPWAIVTAVAGRLRRQGINVC